MATKDTIESLSDEQVYDLLHEKWIEPLVDGLSNLPNSIITDFTYNLEKLASKYNTTFSEVEEQIEETEKELSEMLGLLTGNDFDMLGIEELKKMLGGK